jgi:hypothetical protein
MRASFLLLVCALALHAEVAFTPLAIDEGLWEFRYVRLVDNKIDVQRVCLRKRELSRPLLSRTERHSVCRTSPTESTLRSQQFSVQCSSGDAGSSSSVQITVVDKHYLKGPARDVVRRSIPAASRE